MELKRKFFDYLVAWKNSHCGECLLVNGARQVGKKITLPHYMAMFVRI